MILLLLWSIYPRAISSIKLRHIITAIFPSINRSSAKETTPSSHSTHAIVVVVITSNSSYCLERSS